MDASPILTATEKLLYLGRVAWSQVSLPLALGRLSVAAEHMRERAFPPGAVLAREGEPVARAYLLVRGRVAVARRGIVLGEAEPGSLVGLEALLSQDHLGIGVVTATDVLALEVDSDTVLGIVGEHFPLVHEAIRAAARRLLALTRRLGPPQESSGLRFHAPADRPMNLVERLLFLRTSGGPFERSGIDALAELAGKAVESRFDAGQVFWREGDRAGRVCLVVEGSVACASSREPASRFRVGPGRPLGDLESIAGESRGYDAIAETPGVLLERDVESLLDLFEDNVDIALDYLAWVNRTTLELIEAAIGPGRELLEFFTRFSAPPPPADPAVDRRPVRALERDADLIAEEGMLQPAGSPELPGPDAAGSSEPRAARFPPAQRGLEPPVESGLELHARTGSSGLTDLVVFLDGRAEDAGTVEWAVALAKEHAARLAGVFIQPTATGSHSEMFARGGAIRDVIVGDGDCRRRTEADLRAFFEGAVRRHAIRWEWRPVHGLLVAELVVHARYADLAVVARADPSDQGGIPTALPESLVLTSGRPIVVLPPRCAASHVRRVLVGWNARPEATRAVAGAMPILVRAEAVEVLVVDRNGEAPGHGQEPGADIGQHLARHGVPVEVRRLSSRGEDVGRVLMAEAAAFDADLLVIGAFGHSRLSEWVFGGFTRTALREAALPVLMCR